MKGGDILEQLTLYESPISQECKITDPGQPNISILTFKEGLILEHKVYEGYTTSIFNKDIIISSDNVVRLAKLGDINPIAAGTVIRIDENGITFM